MGKCTDDGAVEAGRKQTNRALVPEAVARTAASYQQFRSQLDALRRQRLALRASAGDWSRSARGVTALNPRGGAAALTLLHESRIAREAFRDEIRHLVEYLRSTGAPLRRILDHIHALLDALQTSGVLRDDGGAMAYELSHWIIEDSSQRLTSPRPEERSTPPAVARGRVKGEARVLPLIRRMAARPDRITG